MRHCFAVNMPAGPKSSPARIPTDTAQTHDSSGPAPPALTPAKQLATPARLTVRYANRTRPAFMTGQSRRQRHAPVSRCSSVASRNVADLLRTSVTIIA